MVFRQMSAVRGRLLLAHHRRSPGSFRLMASSGLSPVHRCGNLAWRRALRNHRAFSVIAH